MVVRRGVALLVVLLAAVIVAPAAAGQTSQTGEDGADGEDDTGVGLRVAVGVDGAYTPGRHLPLRFLIDADRLVSGELRVTSEIDGSDQQIVIPVEVPGGSSKRYVAVVPTSAFDDSGRITIELVENGETIVSDSVRPRFDADAVLVGVLEAVATADELPERVTLALADESRDGVVRLASVGPDLLDAGTAALDVFDSIVVAPTDLSEMTDLQRIALIGWVNSGGDLVVDSESGFVAGLPEQWQPAPDSPASAGSGRVRLSGGGIADGTWAGVFVPAAARSARETQNLGDISGANFGTQSETLTQALSADAGFELPDLPWLLGVLGLYVVVVGPVLYAVFRAVRKPSLLWVAIPLTTLAFTAVVVSLGDRLRDSSEFAHATIIDVGPEGARAYTHILATSRSGGDTGVTLPAGWAGLAPATNPFFGGFPGQALTESAPVTIIAGPAGGTATVELDPGAFERLSATGPIESYTDALAVTATSTTDGQVTGTITNNLQVALADVAIFAGGATPRNLGDLAAGETVDFALRGMSVFSQPFNQPEMTVWPDAFVSFQCCDAQGRPIVPEIDGPRPIVNGAAWSDFTTREAPVLKSRGEVLVVGWTDELDAPITTDTGDIIASGRTALVRRAPILPDGRVTDTTVARRILGGGGNFGQFGPEVVMGFIVPGTASPDRLLTLDLPAWARDARVWAGDEWLMVETNAARSRIAELPPESVVQSMVVVEFTLDYSQLFSGSARVDLLVREPEPGEVLEFVELLTEDEIDAREEAAEAEAEA